MFALYLALMSATAGVGTICAVLASDTLLLAVGLLLITVGAGGLSAGLFSSMSHRTGKHQKGTVVPPGAVSARTDPSRATPDSKSHASPR